MPFRDQEGFDFKTLRAMTAAYDAVLASLKLSPRDPQTGKIAAAIVAMARAGERDPIKLFDGAMAALEKRR